MIVMILYWTMVIQVIVKATGHGWAGTIVWVLYHTLKHTTCF